MARESNLDIRNFHPASCSSPITIFVVPAHIRKIQTRQPRRPRIFHSRAMYRALYKTQDRPRDVCAAHFFPTQILPLRTGLCSHILPDMPQTETALKSTHGARLCSIEDTDSMTRARCSCSNSNLSRVGDMPSGHSTGDVRIDSDLYCISYILKSMCHNPMSVLLNLNPKELEIQIMVAVVSQTRTADARVFNPPRYKVSQARTSLHHLHQQIQHQKPPQKSLMDWTRLGSKQW